MQRISLGVMILLKKSTVTIRMKWRIRTEGVQEERQLNPKIGVGIRATPLRLDAVDGHQSQELALDGHPLEGVLECGMPADHLGVKIDYPGPV